MTTFERWFEIEQENNPDYVPSKKDCRAAWNAALVVAAAKISESDGWDLYPKDYAAMVKEGMAD